MGSYQYFHLPYTIVLSTSQQNYHHDNSSIYHEQWFYLLHNKTILKPIRPFTLHNASIYFTTKLFSYQYFHLPYTMVLSTSQQNYSHTNTSIYNTQCFYLLH